MLKEKKIWFLVLYFLFFKKLLLCYASSSVLKKIKNKTIVYSVYKKQKKIRQQAKVSGAGKRKGKGKEGSTKNKAAVLLLH
jgi:hypothetical protein